VFKRIDELAELYIPANERSVDRRTRGRSEWRELLPQSVNQELRDRLWCGKVLEAIGAERPDCGLLVLVE
jgi:hypothetical protein